MSSNTYVESLERLNKKQRQAVEAIDGPVAVFAGPGTGKTQILTLRIAHIIQTLGADVADSILALTFTNSAVRSMRDRLAEFSDFETAYRVPIFTFHSFAQQVISEYPEHFKELQVFRISSDIERIELLQEILEHDVNFGLLKPLFDQNFYLRDILFSIGQIKSEGLTPDQYVQKVHTTYESELQDEKLYYKVNRGGNKAGDPKPAEIKKVTTKRDKNLELANIYELYQDKLRQHKLFDYSDLILVVLSELEENPVFKAELQERYQYILVDEHQDTNDGQNALLLHLIDNPVFEGKPNIFTVGDAKQSIFRFAGATQNSFKELQDAVPQTLIIELETNYRSGQHVLDQAYKTISEGSEHAQEQVLDSFFKHDGHISLGEFSNYKYELVYIAQEIKKSLEQGVDPNEIAVLYRKNYFAQDLRYIFDVFGIPYKDYSKKNLLDDIHMKKLFLLFRAIETLESDQYLSRLLYTDFLNIHPFTVSKILQKVRNNRKEERKNIYSVISSEKTLMQLDLPKQDIAKLLNVSAFLAEAKTNSENQNFIELFSWIIRESGFLSYVMGLKGNASVLASLDKLFDEIKKESFSKEVYTLSDFVSYITVLKEYKLSIEIPTEHRDGVSLITFHGSKGLEFDTVYLYKAVESRKMPQKLPLALDTYNSSYEDERRLLFVALTRAKKNIYITYPMVDYQDKEQSLLSFLRDQENIETIDTKTYETQYSGLLGTYFAPKQDMSLSLVDPEYIKKRFLSRGLSVSALNNYLDSPVLYFFRNLVMLPEALSDVLEFGNCIHKVLEDYFRDAQNRDELGNKEHMIELYEQVVTTTPRWASYREQAVATLSDYYDKWHKSFVIPLEVEYGVFGVEFPLVSGETITLSGRIDKIEERDGRTVVVDYKTGKSYSEKSGKNKEDTAKKKQAITRQAVFYALLLENYRGGRYATRNVVFDFVQKNKKDQFEQYEVEVSDDQIKDLRQEIETMAQDILTGSFIREVYATDEIDESYKELFDMLVSK